jgi:hypothetical protein
MTTQLMLVAIAVAGATLFLVRQGWRAWSARGCAGGCCKAAASSPASHLIAPDELIGRLRQRQSGGSGGEAKTVDPGKSESFSA